MKEGKSKGLEFAHVLKPSKFHSTVKSDYRESKSHSQKDSVATLVFARVLGPRPQSISSIEKLCYRDTLKQAESILNHFFL